MSMQNHLPVPELIQIQPILKQKQEGISYKKPPKLQPKHYDLSFNRSLNPSSTAHGISFRESDDGEESLLSSMYNKDNPESYFDQCFEVISKIGEGSFGEVFKVKNKENGLLYAIKKSKQLFRSEVYRQERLEEVRRYEQFSKHDHCIRLYRAWEQDDRLYIQLELCKISLDRFVAEHKKFPEKFIWSVLLDLLLALKSLHDQNLIHLDIKLDNILITDDDTCKLADFGLVTDVQKGNILEAMEGDPRYMAPELLEGNFSKAADIFSLGIAILELTCNIELPPNGPLWQQLRNGVLPQHLIKDLSPELQLIIRRMMSPNPANRPTVDELLATKVLMSLYKERKRWIFIKRIKTSARSFKNFMWTKMCNLWNILYKFVTSILISLRLGSDSTLPSQEISISRSSISPRSLKFDDSPNMSLNYFSNGFSNSTPLNHHAISFRKHRKDLNKSTFSSPELSYKVKRLSPINQQSSPIICKKLHFKSDDSD